MEAMPTWSDALEYCKKNLLEYSEFYDLIYLIAQSSYAKIFFPVPDHRSFCITKVKNYLQVGDGPYLCIRPLKNSQVMVGLAIFEKIGYIETIYPFIKNATNIIFSMLDRLVNEPSQKDYDKAIQVYPKNFNCYANRGIYYQKREKHKEAIKDFTRAIKLSSYFDKIILLARRGKSYFVIGDNNKALKDYHKSIQFAKKTNNNYIKYFKKHKINHNVIIDRLKRLEYLEEKYKDDRNNLSEELSLLINFPYIKKID